MATTGGTGPTFGKPLAARRSASGQSLRTKKLILFLWVGVWAGVGLSGAYLLSGSGPVNRLFSLDLDWLLPSLLIMVAGAIAVVLVRALVSARWQEYAALALVGATQTAVAYVTLALLPLVLHDVAQARQYAMQAAALEDGVARLSHLALPFSGLVALLSLYRAASFWAEQTGRSWLPRPFAVAVTLAWGLGIFLMLRSLKPLWVPLPGLGLVTLGGDLAVVAVLLLQYGGTSKFPLLAALGGWARTGYVQAFLLGTLVAFYAVMVRPALYQHLRYAAVLEWIGSAAVLTSLYRLAIGFLNRTNAEEEEEEQWVQWLNHEQVITVTPDANLEYAVQVQREFAESGRREPLLVYVTSVLAWNDVPQHAIVRLVRPLVEYRDEYNSWLRFSWQRTRMERRNHQRRSIEMETLLGRIGEQEKVAGIAHPVLAASSLEAEATRAASVS